MIQTSVSTQVFRSRIRAASRIATAGLFRSCIDADNFKSFNDTFGHPAGDEVLKALADCAKRLFRDTDVCARMGGEEFTVVLPNTTAEGARVIAERFREALRKAPWSRLPYTTPAKTRRPDRRPLEPPSGPLNPLKIGIATNAP